MSYGASSSSSHPFSGPATSSSGSRPGGSSRPGRGGGGGGGGGGSSGRGGGQEASPLADFDMLEWHPQFQSCVRYFVDEAQYTGPVQALAAFINIQLPFQKTPTPILASNQQTSPPLQAAAVAAAPPRRGGPAPAAPGPASYLGPRQAAAGTYPFVTLTPYIRRLVATGFDFPRILHGFFGNDWEEGIGPLHDAERRNYLFASKSDTWLTVKSHYDMEAEQMVPFLRPLQGASEREIVMVEGMWSEWLAMQDWMLGPRAPGGEGDPMVKDEAGN
ncbi:hypothetical protein MKZ38_004656 [Zalerion maritima]|uniref:Uncharacterized protein n=1 Tax=Zalerion maritima TaxID=339359 RepID=A0AAD5WRH6_9PEZI|nr:hypothetical protein MKZ38_004656 [Zalerion maritima]